jgi:hypothetical protein
MRRLGGLCQTDKFPELLKFVHLLENFARAPRKMLFVL